MFRIYRSVLRLDDGDVQLVQLLLGDPLAAPPQGGPGLKKGRAGKARPAQDFPLGKMLERAHARRTAGALRGHAGKIAEKVSPEA